MVIREKCIAERENQKVLNSIVFDPEILTEFGMSNLLIYFSPKGWGNLFEGPTPYLYVLSRCA